jgi:uncharacterized membrane protein YgcG
MPGATVVRIDGTDVTDFVSGNPSIDFAINRRGMARVNFTDRAGTFAPALFSDCTIELEGAMVYGGSILTIRGAEVAARPAAPYASGVNLAIDVPDFAALADRTVYNGITPAGTLRAAVATIVTQLAPFGVTLGAGPSGPDVPALAVPFKTCREPLDQLCQLAGYTWRIDPAKVLWLLPGGATPAPRVLTAPAAKIVSVSWEQTQRLYRSRQWVQFGEPGVRPYTLTATSDGIRTVYPLIGVGLTGEIRPVAPLGIVSVGGVMVPVSTPGDAAHDWWYREEPGAVQLELRPGAPIPIAGTVITATFEAQYPGAVLRVGTGPIVASVDTITSTDDPAAAAEFGDALLRQYGITPRVATIETRYLDFRPGQAVTVNLPAWGFSGVSCLIDTVQIRHVLQQQNGNHAWISRLTVVEGDEGRGSWLDFWRRTLETGGGSGSSFTSGGGTGGGGTGGGGGGLAEPPVFDLGGSREIANLGDTWTPIVDFNDVLLDPADGLTRIVRCHSWVLSSAYTVNVRLVVLAAGGGIEEIQQGTPTNATDQFAAGAFQEFTVTIRGTMLYYRLEMRCSIASGEAWVAGAMLYPA